MKLYKNICIWCLREANDNDVEHIFPEALGCPDFMTLPGSVVCKRCNNELAPLDRAVLDEFDFITFLKGIRRKNNKKPEITSRGNFIGKYAKHGPEMHLNAEKHSVKLTDGTQLTAYKPNGRSVKSEISIQGNIGTVSVTLDFGQGKKFVRGLTKIAVNAFAYLGGCDVILTEEFNDIRNYVKHGGVKRKSLIMSALDSDYLLAIEKAGKLENGYYFSIIRIGTVHFIIDLSPDGSLIDYFSKKAKETYGETGWTTIPQ